MLFFLTYFHKIKKKWCNLKRFSSICGRNQTTGCIVLLFTKQLTCVVDPSIGQLFFEDFLYAPIFYSLQRKDQTALLLLSFWFHLLLMKLSKIAFGFELIFILTALLTPYPGPGWWDQTKPYAIKLRYLAIKIAHFPNPRKVIDFRGYPSGPEPKGDISLLLGNHICNSQQAAPESLRDLYRPTLSPLFRPNPGIHMQVVKVRVLTSLCHGGLSPGSDRERTTSPTAAPSRPSRFGNLYNQFYLKLKEWNRPQIRVRGKKKKREQKG